ncbi:hypothetical protein [Pseudoxanthomonas sp. PXM01]|uniref:hypothetical protein n=1 Tax=Pseudoxanthomonas sp. PXM01 TaxID=2769295 RepID=UPI00177D270E|nr:hypothetical protein [Pseudoxanthomonas sp. PXM01]
MEPECTEPNWKTILTHEAGHAVAALALHAEVADIKLRSSVPRGPASRASYSLPDVESGYAPNPRPPIERVIVYAAGAKAEEVLLGTTNSNGFGSDLRKIERVRDRLMRDADVGHLRSLGLPSESLRTAIANVPQAKANLAAVELEIGSNYPRTREILSRHRNAVELIAKAALERLQEVELVDEIILLPANQVQSLWDECQRVLQE